MFEVLLLSERQKKALLILWDREGATGKKRCTHSAHSLKSSMRTGGKEEKKNRRREESNWEEGGGGEGTASGVKK